MVSLFLLLGCNLSYIVDLFAALHELASASVRTLLKLASSVRVLLKPYGDTLRDKPDATEIIDIFTCEDIISSHVRISYRFYEFVTTRYTTDFYIIKCNT